MGPHGSAARPAKKNEGVEPRPIPHVHASYGRPPPEGESAPAAVLGSCRRVVDGGRSSHVEVCTVQHTSPKQSSRLMASQARGNPHPTNVDRAQPVLLVFCPWSTHLSQTEFEIGGGRPRGSLSLHEWRFGRLRVAWPRSHVHLPFQPPGDIQVWLPSFCRALPAPGTALSWSRHVLRPPTAFHGHTPLHHKKQCKRHAQCSRAVKTRAARQRMRHRASPARASAAPSRPARPRHRHRIRAAHTAGVFLGGQVRSK